MQRRLGGVGRIGWLAVVAPPLTACTTGPLDPHGPVAAAERTILGNATVIMLCIIVPTIAMAILFTWWFRATNPRAKFRPHFVYSGRVEIVMWAVPILTVTFITGLIWTGTQDLDPYQPLHSNKRRLEIQVVALDWKWLFIYPEQGVASVNALVLPVGTPVHFSMTSASVLNTFYIPQLGGMIYVMNRMVTQEHLQADQAGDYLGRSGMFSGDGFPDMQFTTHAVPDAQFTQWVDTVRQGQQPLDRAAYAQLEKQSVPKQPFTYRWVDPDLFRAIATQDIPPAPGPSGDTVEKAEK